MVSIEQEVKGRSTTHPTTSRGTLRPTLPPQQQRWHYHHLQAGHHLRPPLAWAAKGHSDQM